MQKIIWAGAIFLGLLLGFLLFYRPEPLTERKRLEAEAEMHKVKRITQQQIDATALRVGDSLVHTADSLLHVRIKPFLKTGDLAAALKNYPPQQYPEIQQLAQKYGATITRSGQKLPFNSPDSAQVKTGSNTEILYSKAILVNNALCLNCHGTVGQEVTAANLAELQRANPGFEATGFKNGETIGSWQIKLKRQVLLENLSRRSRKNLKPE